MGSSFRIAGVVDEPGYSGLPAPDVHVADGSEIAIAGIRDGTQQGNPTLALSIPLDDGRTVLVETTWRLWAVATKYFADRFGERPDTVGMALEYDAGAGDGAKTRLEIVDDSAPKFVECELCGQRRTPEDFAATHIGQEDRELAMVQWLRRHFLEKHPGWSAPR